MGCMGQSQDACISPKWVSGLGRDRLMLTRFRKNCQYLSPELVLFCCWVNGPACAEGTGMTDYLVHSADLTAREPPRGPPRPAHSSSQSALASHTCPRRWVWCQRPWSYQAPWPYTLNSDPNPKISALYTKSLPFECFKVAVRKIQSI